MAQSYLSAEGKRNLHKYVYTGKDLSYSYNYVLSPIAEYLVQFIPLWVA